VHARRVYLILAMLAALQDGSARRLRISNGLTLKVVGDACGVTSQAVARWESGSRVPRGAVALRYAPLLNRVGLPRDYGLTDTGTKVAHG